MFAPKPSTDDGWYVIPARLWSGTEVDLMTGQGPVRWDKPANIRATYNNDRWRKYLLTIWEQKNADYRLYFARHLCRSWNAAHEGEEMLDTFEIYFIREETLPGDHVAPLQKVKLWNHHCF